MLKKTILVLLFIFVSLSIFAQSTIWINVSYKVVLNPQTGLREAGITDLDLQKNVEDMNTLLAATLRGYRFRVAEIANIGGFNQTPSLQWFKTDISTSNNQLLESTAKANPKAYLWREEAINIYITQGDDKLIPDAGVPNIIVINGKSDYSPAEQLHQIGRYFGLERESDDFLISHNLMTEKGTRTQFTDHQMDTWTDYAMDFKRAILDKPVSFIETSNSPSGNGTSQKPYPTLRSGINNARENEVLILKPGSYDESLVIDKPLVLRSTRAGVAILGANMNQPSLQALNQFAQKLHQEYEVDASLGSAYVKGQMAFMNKNAFVETSVDDEQPFILYPNPSQGIFTVDIDPELFKAYPQNIITIYNAQGEIVQQRIARQNQILVDLTSCQKGVYQVKLKNSQDELAIQKLIYR